MWPQRHLFCLAYITPELASSDGQATYQLVRSEKSFLSFQGQSVKSQIKMFLFNVAYWCRLTFTAVAGRVGGTQSLIILFVENV